MKLDEFDFDLPKALIAQTPAKPRDHSRLMVINRKTGSITHDFFYHLPHYLTVQNFMVFNDTKVFPARLIGQKPTGGKVEVFLVAQEKDALWRAKTHPGLKKGQVVTFSKKLQSVVTNVYDNGQRQIKFVFNPTDDLNTLIDRIGQTPTPPYIKKPVDYKEQYQTIYAKNRGAIAAPTAGLHFTNRLFSELKTHHITFDYLTLHVGLGTFEPISDETIAKKALHNESFFIPNTLADRLYDHLNKSGNHLVSVGTTALRALESAALQKDPLLLKTGWQETTLFIQPGYHFKAVDKLITNFHLPKSSLLMLVCAFGGADLMKKAYQEAVAHQYRFFSFGDAMLIS